MGSHRRMNVLCEPRSECRQQGRRRRFAYKRQGCHASRTACERRRQEVVRCVNRRHPPAKRQSTRKLTFIPDQGVRASVPNLTDESRANKATRPIAPGKEWCPLPPGTHSFRGFFCAHSTSQRAFGQQFHGALYVRTQCADVLYVALPTSSFQAPPPRAGTAPSSRANCLKSSDW